jgi:hypothetical protein
MPLCSIATLTFVLNMFSLPGGPTEFSVPKSAADLPDLLAQVNC